MGGIITILVFSALISAPVFYIITRKLFPKHSKKSASWISMILTTALVGMFAFSMLTAL